MTKLYKGKEIFLESLVANGVEYIFGNPGTTELPIIDSLADHPNIKYIMALHESVAVGAANYYAQASRKTGVINLHVAPGLGNAPGRNRPSSTATPERPGPWSCLWRLWAPPT